MPDDIAAIDVIVSPTPMTIDVLTSIGPRGDPGPIGPQGPQGPPGEPATGPPQLHAYTHYAGGTDPASITALGGYPGDSVTFLRADGVFAPLTTGLMALTAMATPAAPPADHAHLWLQDDGSGKSQLMIQFATGAPIAIATQP